MKLLFDESLSPRLVLGVLLWVGLPTELV